MCADLNCSWLQLSNIGSQSFQCSVLSSALLHRLNFLHCTWSVFEDLPQGSAKWPLNSLNEKDLLMLKLLYQQMNVIHQSFWSLTQHNPGFLHSFTFCCQWWAFCGQSTHLLIWIGCYELQHTSLNQIKFQPANFVAQSKISWKIIVLWKLLQQLLSFFITDVDHDHYKT